MAQKPGLVNWLLVIFLSVIWGASFMNVKIALTGFGPVTIAACRITLAAAALLMLARAMGQRLPGVAERRIWAHVLGMAVFSNIVPFTLLSWGQLHVASGFAGITMSVVPLFTMLLSAWLLPDARLTPARLVGVGLGIAGVILLIGPRAFAATGADMEGLARLACLGSTLSYAIGSITTRRCPPVPLVALSASALLVAAVAMVPLALLAEGWPDFAGAGLRACLSLAYLGLFPTALATVLLVRVIQSAGPNFLSMSNYQVPVWSVIFGTVLLGERLPASFLAALVLILAGLAVSNAPAFRRRP